MRKSPHREYSTNIAWYHVQNLLAQVCKYDVAVIPSWILIVEKKTSNTILATALLSAWKTV